MLKDKIIDGISWRFKPVIRHISRYKKVFIVQNYHRIFKNKLATQFDEGVFGGISQEYLHTQLKFLAKHYDIMSEQDLLYCLKANAFPRKSLMVTFDDGYKDNYTLAYPLLRDLGISALFFIPTRALTNRQLGWWDLASYSIKMTTRDTVEIDDRVFNLRLSTEKNEAIKTTLHKLYRLPHAEAKALLEKLTRDLQVAPPDATTQSNELMDHKELKEMLDNGMSIGAHTHSHKVLSTLRYETQSLEIRLSKQTLESTLGTDVRSFAYPVGTAYSFDATTKELVRKHGFSLAFSFYSGVNIPANIDPFDIKRTFRGLPYEGFLESFREPYTFIRPKQ